jgi:hypothetical protein
MACPLCNEEKNKELSGIDPKDINKIVEFSRPEGWKYATQVDGLWLLQREFENAFYRPQAPSVDDKYIAMLEAENARLKKEIVDQSERKKDEALITGMGMISPEIAAVFKLGKFLGIPLAIVFGAAVYALKKYAKGQNTGVGELFRERLTELLKDWLSDDGQDGGIDI